MGTMIQARGLTEEDYRGQEFARHGKSLRLNNDVLCITQPKLVEDVHRQYLEAGADIIETNTFNANAVSLAEYGLTGHAYEINLAGARAARRRWSNSASRAPNDRRSWPARWGRPAVPLRSRRTSRIRVRARSPLTSCARLTTTRPGASWTAEWIFCWSKPSLIRLMPRPRSLP